MFVGSLPRPYFPGSSGAAFYRNRLVSVPTKVNLSQWPQDVYTNVLTSCCIDVNSTLYKRHVLAGIYKCLNEKNMNTKTENLVPKISVAVCQRWVADLGG